MNSSTAPIPHATLRPSLAASAQEDRELLELIARHRDAMAFSTLVKKHERAALNLALRITQRPNAAEELCQEALLTLWQSAKSFHGTGSVRSWLLRIVALKGMRVLRSRNRERFHLARKITFTEEPRMIAPSENVERADVLHALRCAWKHLSKSNQRLLNLYYGEGHSQNKISEILSMPSRTVSYQIQHGLQRLRAELGRAGFASPLSFGSK